jgi:hypothetical protein
VRSFFEWFEANERKDKPWLILGKGPTFARRSDFDLSRFRLMSLNHAVREQPVDVAHIIDIDVVEACAAGIERNARVLVMPWFPHVHNAVGVRNLAELARELPLLAQLEQLGRLLWYDLSTSAVRYGSGPVVEATYFSAEAALNLLATAGVRSVRSLGVDGGSAYSPAFQDLRDSTLLANGRTSFDLQFEGFARTINRTGIDFSPVDQPFPARVLTAFTPEEALPAAVLHHSIRRRASLSVETVAIPDGAAGGLKSPALVISPRTQFLTDLRKLWGTPVPDREVFIPRGLSASGPALGLVGGDSDAFLPVLASAIRLRTPGALIEQAGVPSVRSELPQQWAPGNPGEPGFTALILYYPPDGTEPWRSRRHPLGHLWVRDLLDAVARGRIQPALVAEQVALGHVRPSLLYQVEHGLEEPLLLPRRARLLDRESDPAPAPQWGPMLGALGRQLGRWTRGLRAGVTAPR